MKHRLKKLTKHSIFKSLIVTLLFVAVYQLNNFEIVREKFEDAGFDLTSKMFFSTKLEKAPNAPSVVLFGFDDLYLKEHGLFDEDNRTNYGYLFPREHIAKFIQNFDKVSHRLIEDEKQPPKALFIDMDFSFGSNVEGNLSASDEALLDVLEQEDNRSYTLLFPKTRTANFIEDSKRLKIQQMIESKKIVFASVGFTTSKDNATRRYYSHKTFSNPYDEGNTTYPHVGLLLWYLTQNKESNLSQLTKGFELKDIVNNRILFKQYQKAKYEYTKSQMKKSHWKGLTSYSANYQYQLNDELLENAVVIVGTTYHNNGDEFEVLASGNSINMSGTEVHANMLMTLFYFNGQLKALSMWFMIPLVFVLVFLLDFGVAYLLFKLKRKENKWTMVGVLVLTLALMLLVSLMLLPHGIWFNWFIPMILYDLIDVILG